MHFGVDFAVYRLLPTQCHSELCAHVVDAIASGGGDLSSRHLSTLTRVMPVQYVFELTCSLTNFPHMHEGCDEVACPLLCATSSTA